MTIASLSSLVPYISISSEKDVIEKSLVRSICSCSKRRHAVIETFSRGICNKIAASIGGTPVSLVLGITKIPDRSGSIH